MFADTLVGILNAISCSPSAIVELTEIPLRELGPLKRFIVACNTRGGSLINVQQLRQLPLLQTNEGGRLRKVTYDNDSRLCIPERNCFQLVVKCLQELTHCAFVDCQEALDLEVAKIMGFEVLDAKTTFKHVMQFVLATGFKSERRNKLVCHVLDNAEDSVRSELKQYSFVPSSSINFATTLKHVERDKISSNNTPVLKPASELFHPVKRPDANIILPRESYCYPDQQFCESRILIQLDHLGMRTSFIEDELIACVVSIKDSGNAQERLEKLLLYLQKAGVSLCFI